MQRWRNRCWLVMKWDKFCGDRNIHFLVFIILNKMTYLVLSLISLRNLYLFTTDSNWVSLEGYVTCSFHLKGYLNTTEKTCLRSTAQTLKTQVAPRINHDDDGDHRHHCHVQFCSPFYLRPQIILQLQLNMTISLYSEMNFTSSIHFSFKMVSIAFGMVKHFDISRKT